MSIPFELRPATMYDKDFMMHLEKVTWVRYLESDPDIDVPEWDDDWQKEYYEKYFRPKHVSIIEHKGQPIGAYSAIIKRNGIYIVYLYLLPEYEDSGIKETLIKDILERAKEEHKQVMTCVYKGDDIDRELCVRLGFEVFREDGIRQRMKWVPP